jgi:hypothetical protein
MSGMEWMIVEKLQVSQVSKWEWELYEFNSQHALKFLSDLAI